MGWGPSLIEAGVPRPDRARVGELSNGGAGRGRYLVRVVLTSPVTAGNKLLLLLL